MATMPRVVDVICLIFVLLRLIYCQSPTETGSSMLLPIGYGQTHCNFASMP